MSHPARIKEDSPVWVEDFARMQSWDGLRLELLKYGGYKRVAFIELSCKSHGDIRVGFQDVDDDAHYPCPLCNTSCPCAFLCFGFTRREAPFWEIASRPLPLNIRGEFQEQKVQPRYTLRGPALTELILLGNVEASSEGRMENADSKASVQQLERKIQLLESQVRTLALAQRKLADALKASQANGHKVSAV